MTRKKSDNILLEDNPLYDSFDEVLFEKEVEIYCYRDDTESDAVITVGEIYDTLNYSVEDEEVQIIDDEGKKVWVEAELFVSCEDIDEDID